jgi:hypothetical protein
MQLFKKLFFAFPFLIFFFLMLLAFKPLIEKYYQIFFSFDLQSLFVFIILTALVVLSSIFYVTFIVISQKWEYVIPTIVIASLMPILIVPINLGIVLMLGFLIVLSLIYYQIIFKLKSYINFDPKTLLSPFIKSLNLLIILVITVTLFFYLNTEVKNNGFKLPDSVFNMALKISMSGLKQQASIISSPSTKVGNQTTNKSQSFSLTKEQLDLLKQNPELLKQYGIDPSVLNDPALLSSVKVGETQNSEIGMVEPNNDLMKIILKDQFQKIIQPYMKFIPLFLIMLFFFSITFFLSIISLIVTPFVALLFNLLKQTGFVKYEQVMTPVDKLIV